ncbi:hypothetical protein CUJ84_Chr000736 [Rhizobium leguminosarum]|uniref:Uncharacterized protein n=1 Tax=Rhizobium leguminosarum TaxID=384 RepID=A0A2K9YYS3_RHILE|nr:hypothetical protein CUJ84_Chr000736 [Rhizobium leguminosarum]
MPTVLPVLSPSADEAPVPTLEAEFASPEPAAEPPVPTVLLEVPPPADEPPVPTVEDEPDLQLVAPAGQSPPAELPPVPIVLLAVPPPADEPPVPTVLDDCAKPETAVPAKRAAAKARCVAFIMVYSSVCCCLLSHPERMDSWVTNFGFDPLFLP